MSVWNQIDELKKRHDREFSKAAQELEGGGLRAIKGSLRTDELGFWRVRYYPKGEPRQDELSARTSVELIARLTAIRAAEAGKAKVG